jgi:molecular chaperone GrpE
MSKRFKDDDGGDSPINLTPEAEVHSHHSHGSRSHSPTPLTVDETVEVLGEMDRLNERIHRQTERIRELTAELAKQDEEIAKLKGQPGAERAASDDPPASPPSDKGADVEAKDKEIAELKDKYLRALAEHENARRRIRQQSEDSIKRQKELLLHDLLPIVDNLERAVEAAKGKGDGKSIVEGVQMVLASLMDLLKANSVVPMKTVGEQFDPNKHEAADHVPHSAHPPNTVVSEFHRGYHINDKVLRPARVVVSKGDGDSKDG